MGMGAMAAVMLRLPLTSVLLATLLLGSDGLAVTPLVIVAVAVAYVVAARLTPAAAPGAGTGRGPDAAPAQAGDAQPPAQPAGLPREHGAAPDTGAHLAARSGHRR
jgi:hypothetical protein